MAKRTRYVVHLPDDHIARFSDHDHAMQYARVTSKMTECYVEVSEPLGLIGQFHSGIATPEFAHLNTTPDA